MKVKVYKMLNVIISYFVLFCCKVYDFVADCFSFVYRFFRNLVQFLRLIWSGFEFSNLFKAIKLSFGAVLLSAKNSYESIRADSEKRAFKRQQNVNFFTTNTWCELSLFHLASNG